MKINFKQTIVKLIFSDKTLLTLLACAVLFFIFSSNSFAPTKAMSDSDLSEVSAQALFQITQYSGTSAFGYNTGSANVVRLSLNIDMEIMAHITSFKMGYYDNGTTTGWDQDVTNYFWGSVNHTTSTLLLHGLFADFGFDNIGNNATRTLNYIEVGSMDTTGQVTGTINTLNGLVSNLGTGQNNGVLIRTTASGTRTIHFSHEVLSFIFATKYRYVDNGGNATSGLSGIWTKIPNYNSNYTT
jgi:hypothetical protein